MTRFRVWVLALLILAAIVSATLVAFNWRRPIDARPLGPSTTAIVPGLSILCGLGPSAAYVVETTEGLVLIDSGLDSNAELLKNEMTKLGLNWRDIRAILLTHTHGDHCGGAEYLRAATKAKVYAGQDDVPTLKAGGPREAFFSTFHMPYHSPHPTQVDVALAGGESITFGDTTFKALAMPGHTPGSICYLMERGGLRALFGGDVISMLVGDGNPHPTGMKPLGTYSAYLSPRFRGDARTYLESIHKLRALPVPDLVLPGHPASDPTPQNPHLSKARWEEMLDVGIRNMETLLARYKADGADFLDGHPKELLKDLYYLGNFQGSAVYAFFAASKLIVVDAPGGEGYYDFLKTQLKALSLPANDPVAVLLTSCNTQDTTGLKALVDRCHPQVVASPDGLPIAKEICPPNTTILSADDWSKQSGLDVKTIPLAGRGRAPIAYLLEWDGKKVLISGRLPILFDRKSTEALSADLASSRENTIDYLTSINRLGAVKPDLWLPAAPSNDQNANIYDAEWKYIISNNYRAGRSILDQPR